MAESEDFERLSPLPDRCPTWAEVGTLLDRLSAARDEIEHLEALLREANEAFDEVTDAYAQSLVEGEEWRTYAADELAGEGGTSDPCPRCGSDQNPTCPYCQMIDTFNRALTNADSSEALDEIAAISQAAGLDELTGEPPIRRPYPLVGPHQGDTDD